MKRDEIYTRYLADVVDELETISKNEPLVLGDIDREGIFEEHMMQMGFRPLNPEGAHDVYACTPKMAYEFHQHAREIQRQDSSGPGTMTHRFEYLLNRLAELFPEEHQPLAAEPPENRFLKAIEALLVKVR